MSILGGEMNWNPDWNGWSDAQRLGDSAYVSWVEAMAAHKHSDEELDAHSQEVRLGEEARRAGAANRYDARPPLRPEDFKEPAQKRAYEAGIVKYRSKRRCPKCGTNIRYSRSRGCVLCTQYTALRARRTWGETYAKRLHEIEAKFAKAAAKRRGMP